MAGSINTPVANATLDFLFGAGVNALAPATYYLAAFTVAPTNAGGGTEVPSANGYARLALTNNATNFPAAASREKENGVDWEFAASSAAWASSAPIVAVALMDASSGGNMKAWCDAAPAQAITGAGQAPRILAGQFTITVP